MTDQPPTPAAPGDTTAVVAHRDDAVRLEVLGRLGGDQVILSVIDDDNGRTAHVELNTVSAARLTRALNAATVATNPIPRRHRWWHPWLNPNDRPIVRLLGAYLIVVTLIAGLSAPAPWPIAFGAALVIIGALLLAPRAVRGTLVRRLTPHRRR